MNKRSSPQITPSSGESHADSLKSGEQARALVLADELLDGMDDEHWNQLKADAAAELRRLHAENEALRAMSFDTKRSQTDEALLRQALEALVDARVRPAHKQDPSKYEAAIAAIKERLK